GKLKNDGSQSTIPVCGDPVRTGDQGVSALSADRRSGRGLCVAEEPDRRAGPADPQARAGVVRAAETERKAAAAAGPDAFAPVPRGEDPGTEPGPGAGATVAEMGAA